jgi:hypothetical protein
VSRVISVQFRISSFLFSHSLFCSHSLALTQLIDFFLPFLRVLVMGIGARAPNLLHLAVHPIIPHPPHTHHIWLGYTSDSSPRPTHATQREKATSLHDGGGCVRGRRTSRVLRVEVAKVVPLPIDRDHRCWHPTLFSREVVFKRQK